ncbi:MAG TPA: ABC transporter permease [Vicinamibacteria bacterium]|nr:ABC transporter permease [Vicinamibacteria bacterium]
MNVWTQAVRQLLRAPAFAIVSALALALGIGSTTTIFSIVRAVLLRALPYAEPEALVQLSSSVPEQQIQGAGFSVPRFEAVRDRQTVFSGITYSAFTAFTLTGQGGEPEQVQGVRAAHDFLPLLGLTPALGRGFAADEDRPGGADVVLLSHGLWQRRFGGAADVVGRTIDLDGHPHTVIGVMPRTASQFPMNQVALWTPRPQDVSFLVRQQIEGGGFFFQVIARLKPGTTLVAARAQVADIARAYSVTHPANADVKASADVDPLLDALVGDQRETFGVVFAAVACLLLIASANVANLTLARCAARRKLIAIRYALGAGRRHITGELVAENVVLALVGGGLGIALAGASLGLVKQWAGDRIPRVDEVSLDTTVILFSLGISLLTGFVLGLLPAWHAAKPDLTSALKDGGRDPAGGKGSSRLRSTLLVAEVAVSFVLLVASGLLVASFLRIQKVDPQFRATGILVAGLQPPTVRYPDGSEPLARFYERVLERARNLPGVTGAAIADSPPLVGGGGGQSPFAVVGQPIPPIGKQPVALRHIVSEGFFDLLGVRVTAGRRFGAADNTESPQVVIINEALARQAFPDRDPIGQRLLTGMLQREAEVVGVVSNTRSIDLAAAPVAEMFYPVLQRPENFTNVLVKTGMGDPLALLGSLRKAVAEVDGDIPLTNPDRYETRLAQNTAVRRMIMTLLTAFAAAALLLSMFGVYSVMAYAVGQRTSEIGVRMAMGALPEQVRGMVVKQGLGLTGIGVAFGITGALLATRLMRSMLFETPAADPIIYLGITALLVATATLACWLPARRAAAVDPLIAIREP